VGTDNVVLQGALMNFQAVHGLSWNTGMTTETWQLLLQAAIKKQYDPTAYNYVVVSQAQPEMLKLYVNGHHVYNTFVNTGVSSAPTAAGTWPVYERFTVTTMSGTYPGGGHYSDPGIPWVSYFHGGDALHGFLRSQYGFPQSLGCVEMPFANAQHLWPYTPIGTLVSVLATPKS
jgi:lipoprotein-anchoring transpeptidase ErfK/SrfK